ARMVVQEIREAVRAGGLLDGGRPIVAMVSGGRDSVCLLDVATALYGATSVVALHVNYRLRADADLDERACAQLCDGLGVSLSVVRAGAVEGNVQAWARELRYAAARELAAGARQGPDDPPIATGHTASDQ